MRTDEGMVRISLSRVVRADWRRIRSPEHASVLIKCLASLPNASLWGDDPTAGPARDTNRDTKCRLLRVLEAASGLRGLTAVAWRGLMGRGRLHS